MAREDVGTIVAVDAAKGGGEKLALPWKAAVTGLVISAVFTAFFLLGIQWDEFSAIPATLNYSVVMLASAVLFLEFPMRAIRWGVLVEPLRHRLPKEKSTGVVPLTFRHLTTITFIGFMANNVLPARAGELVRPYLASVDSKLPFESVLITCVLERGFDILGLVFVALLFFLMLPASGASEIDSLLLSQLTDGAMVLGGLAALGLLFMVLVAVRGELLRPFVTWCAKFLPRPVARLGLRLFDGLLIGVASLEDAKCLLISAGLSLIMWVNGAVASWILMEAFSLNLPIAASFFLSLIIAFSVALPQAPGFIGVFQVATQATLMAWGVEVAQAQGFAVVFWLIGFVPITLAGFAALSWRGLSIRHLVKKAAEAAPDLRAQSDAA